MSHREVNKMTDTLNKKALVDIVAEQTGVTKKSATETVELVFNTIANTLQNGGKVDIPGFGKFEVKHRNSRTGINPATREAIEIPATNVPTFKAAKALKDCVK